MAGFFPLGPLKDQHFLDCFWTNNNGLNSSYFLWSWSLYHHPEMKSPSLFCPLNSSLRTQVIDWNLKVTKSLMTSCVSVSFSLCSMLTKCCFQVLSELWLKTLYHNG